MIELTRHAAESIITPEHRAGIDSRSDRVNRPAFDLALSILWCDKDMMQEVQEQTRRLMKATPQQLAEMASKSIKTMRHLVDERRNLKINTATGSTTPGPSSQNLSSTFKSQTTPTNSLVVPGVESAFKRAAQNDNTSSSESGQPPQEAKVRDPKPQTPDCQHKCEHQEDSFNGD